MEWATELIVWGERLIVAGVVLPSFMMSVVLTLILLHGFIALAYSSPFHRALLAAWFSNLVYLVGEARGGLLIGSRPEVAVGLFVIVSNAAFIEAADRTQIVSRAQRAGLHTLNLLVPGALFAGGLITPFYYSVSALSALSVGLVALSVHRTRSRPTLLINARPTAAEEKHSESNERGESPTQLLLSMLPPNSTLTSVRKLERMGVALVAAGYTVYAVLQSMWGAAVLDLADTKWPALFFIFAGVSKLTTLTGFGVILFCHIRATEEGRQRQEISSNVLAVTYAVEHDLRLPLSELRLKLETMKSVFQNDDKVSKSVRQLDSIRRKIHDAVEVVAMVRENRAEAEADFEKVNVLRIANKSLDAVRRVSGRPLYCNPQSTHSVVFVHGNAVRLERAFTNVINNAVEATRRAKPESKSVQLECKVSRTDQAVTVTFADKGDGIPPENLDRIFEPGFSTKKNANKRNAGLGLYTARLIADLHRGKLNASNLSSEGAELVFTFPNLT